ncbi:hypothetical protein [Streptomyces sp. IBSBF 3010]|uniref:hypothetical protein n=1 Tax=Streptomyces sp. IBSBF 3010 TaxID=2903526 RepID=UPI002FDC660B
MKLDLVLKEVHHGENALAVRLMRLSSTHSTDHEVHHVARDLAAWSRQHVRELAEAAADHGVDLDPEPKEQSQPPPGCGRKAASSSDGVPRPGCCSCGTCATPICGRRPSPWTDSCWPRRPRPPAIRNCST